MAIGLRRKVRLDSRRERQSITRHQNSDHKRPERARRDARLQAKLAAQFPVLGKDGMSADLQSWVSAQLGRPVSKLSDSDITSLIA